MVRQRHRLALVGLVSAALLSAFFLYDFEPRFVPASPAIEVSDEARSLHAESIVIDLHVDSLLWSRDLAVRGSRGHADLPRMREGGLDAVAFTVPTRFFGVGGLKAFHDLWPPSTWFSPWRRLLYQLDKARRLGEARLATSAEEVRRNTREGMLSYFHGIEGAHALEGDVGRVRELAAKGVLFVGLVHLSDNEIGGSSSGSNQGLTARGRELVAEMNRAGLLVDLAHASERTFAEALELTELPPLVSHSGVRVVHDSWRNLSDAQIRAVSERGGVIGVMLAPPALAEPSLEEALRHLEHVIEMGGEDAAAIGSDFDGYIHPPIDASGLPLLTELMLRRGFSHERIRKVLGENALRVLSRAWEETRKDAKGSR